MKILVTGGRGFLGSRLVKRLAEKGNHELFMFSTSMPGNETIVRHENIFSGDLRDAKQAEKAFEHTRFDIVCHLAANINETDKGMYEDNIAMTRNIVELCSKYDTGKLVFMSTTGNTQKESMEINAKTPYQKSKKVCESIVKSSGIKYTIIRAPVILGPNSIWLSIAKAAKKGYPVIGSGKNRFHLAYVEDVVSILCNVLDNPASENHVFNVATKDVPTYMDVYSMICSELGTSLPKRHIPAFAAMLAAFFHETLSALLGRKPNPTLVRQNIKRLLMDRVISIENARDLLGFEPAFNTKTGISETIKYFKSKGML